MPSKRSRGTFVCKYLSFYDAHLKRTFRLPLVHIRVKHSDVTFRTDALIDSGATATFMPVEIAKILEMDQPKETQDAVGAGGTFSTYKSQIELIEIFKGPNVFCRLKESKVLIPTVEGIIPHTILGRDSIFWLNDITFREHRKHTIFRHPKK